MPARSAPGWRWRSANHLAGLIDGLLDIAKIEAGKLDLSRDEVSIASFLDEIVGMFAIQASTKKIEFVFTPSPDLPATVATDAKRLRQIIINLLSNAITHGRPDQPVRVAAWARDGALTLSVANACDPIPDAKIAQLFKPYVRGRSATASAGLGLGLHIAAEIARAHGGIITVASQPAETRFTLVLPLPSGQPAVPG